MAAVNDVLAGNNDTEKLANLNKRTYKEQAIWFLNAYFDKFAEAEAENIWLWMHRFQDLDPRKKLGNELDEFQAHRFLESIQQTLTVVRMREVLRELDLDFNQKMSMAEFLLYHYSHTRAHLGGEQVGIKSLVNAPQSAHGEMDQAQRLLEAAEAALQEALSRANAARAGEAEATARAEQARGAEQEAQKRLVAARAAEGEAERQLTAARNAETEARTAQEAQAAALAELQKQEDAYNGQIKALQTRIESGSLGVAQLGIVKNELAQLQQEDPLPLRRAKINQQSALNRVTRSANAATNAREKSDAAAAEARKARESSDFAAKGAAEAREASDAAAAQATLRRSQADDAAAAAETSFNTASAFMEEVKARASAGKGSLWFMERELAEVRRYLPPKRQA